MIVLAITMCGLSDVESIVSYFIHLVGRTWRLYESTMQRHIRQAMGRSRTMKPSALPNPMVYCELIQKFQASDPGILSDSQAVLVVCSHKEGC